jgi:hypothetical protein
MRGEKKRRYEIDVNKLDVGILATKLIEAFNLHKSNAILVAEYFKRTTKALSNEDRVTYILDNELPELFCLALDHLLEYEYGSPELSGTLGEILNLYERVIKEDAAVYGIIGRLWELKDSEWQLPFTVGELRKVFPFPVMNPIVKSHTPADMRKKWEGKGLPLWKWAEGNVAVLFFASERDFESYFEKDEFLSLALPDSRGVLSLLATGEKLKGEKHLIAWLKTNEKLQIIELPPLLTDFLLSATGEMQGEPPGDIQLYLKNFREDKEDILLSRKAEIYREAMDEITRNSLPKPVTFYKGVLPDADTVWGKSQIADRDISVSGIALAFADLTREERQILAELRELFKGGREGKGSGDLHALLPRGGYPTLVDDILPRYGTKRELKDSEPISRLKGYWRSEERSKLIGLARILHCDAFLRLHSDEDMSRLLEALWRTVRGEFVFEGMDSLIQKFERDILPVLKECRDLEKKGVRDYGLNGLNFEDNETLVKALSGFEKLLEIAKRAIDEKASASVLVKCIVRMFMSSLDVENQVRRLASLSGSATRALEELEKASNDLKKNFWEYPKATKFLGMTEDSIKKLVSEQTRMSGTPTLQKLETDAKERKEYFERISHGLGQLDKKLGELQSIFDQMKKEE